MNIDINNVNSSRTDGPKRQAGGKSVEPANQAGNPAPSDPSSASKDNVSLSSSAQNLSRIEAELKSLPEVNQSRVDEVRARIDRGEYQPDSANLAQKMLSLE
jgi:negative regulator of flagellin synthesis FlgM